MRTKKQIIRQNYRDDSGKYAKVYPCYRCGKSAGEEYFSFMGDRQDSLGNDWNDTALCLCQKCAAHLEKLYAKNPSAPWEEAHSQHGGNYRKEGPRRDEN